jgi:hypothetical protein
MVNLGVDLGPNLRQRTQFGILSQCAHLLFSRPLHPPRIGPEYDSVSIKEQGKQDKDGEGEP